MPDLPRPIWNSLEIIKVITQILLPIALIFITLLLRPVLGRVEKRIWTHQKLIEKRLAVFDLLARPLDDIRCFFTYSGHCNDLKPPDILTAGNAAAVILRINAPLFSPAFCRLFAELHQLCFSEPSQAENARLRTRTDDRRSPTAFAWQLEWDELFSNEPKLPTAAEVEAAHQNFVASLSKEIGVDLNSGDTPKAVHT